MTGRAPNPRGQIFAILGGLTKVITRRERLQVCGHIIGRDIDSLNDLAAWELEYVRGALFSWEKSGHLEAQLAEILGRRAA